MEWLAGLISLLLCTSSLAAPAAEVAQFDPPDTGCGAPTTAPNAARSADPMQTTR